MRIFKSLYQKVLNWAKHRHAPYYLAGVSLADASFFPIPPDVMLVPMVLSHPPKTWHYASIATAFSLIGSLLGYALGYYAFEWINLHGSAYEAVVRWFNRYGFYAVIFAGLTPIPFKVFTITAGATQMILMPFLLAAMIGRSLRYFLVAGFAFFFLSGCSLFTSEEPAPVVALKNKPEVRETRTHHLVKTGDTVFLIAWLYDMDYEDLVSYNHLHAPYHIYAGQKLRLTPEKNLYKKPAKILPPQTTQWLWPAQGKVTKVPKGIDISGNYGSDILATQSGKVVYAGDNLRGYGKLVIIKHRDPYLSAYAHNSELLVKEGDAIKKGQIIAKMGNTDSNQTKLHFEIREHGNPINPLIILH